MHGTTPLTPALSFIAEDGELGAMIRAHDWSATPLGAPETWPQSLRSALSICLHSSFPTAIYWGPELRLLYNDAWAPILVERHPRALGRPGAEVWADIWHVVGPDFERALATGEGVSAFDQMLPMLRGGEVHETYWNYSLTPIRGEDGAVVGLFNQGNETTARVLGERRDRFLLSLSDRLRALSDPRAVIDASQEALGRHLNANRVGYGEVDDTARFFTTERNWTDGSVPSREGTHDLAAFGPPVLASLRAGTPLLIRDAASDPRTNAPDSLAAFDGIDTRAVIAASLVKDGRMRAALYVHAREARPWTADDAALATEVAERTWSAHERVRAETLLRESEARLRFLSELDERLRGSSDAFAAMRIAAELLARRLDASRCAYAAVDPDNDSFTIHDDYTAPGLASSAGTYSLDLFGPRAAADMRAGRRLVIRDVADELAAAEGREMFHAIGIEAIVCCPLIKNGQLVAMMAVHQNRARDWRADELALVEVVVERCWGHIQRVGAEARQRDSETRYRTLFESIESGFCVVEVDLEAAGHGVDYRVIEANPAFYRQTGLPDDILGRWLRAAAPALEEHWYDVYGRVARTGEPVRFEQGSDMLGRWFDVYAFRVEGSERRRVAILFNDITSRRTAEERLRELNETLERRVAEALAERKILADIVEGTDAFVQVVDPDYRWLAINKAAADEFERIFGPRPKVGDRMLDLLAGQPEQRAAVEAIWNRALAGEEFTEIAEFGDPARDRRCYEMKYNTLRDVNGERIGAYQFVYDVTERVRDQKRFADAEEQLRQSQKMEAVGQLTGGVAHDFNNLLTIIKSSTELLRRPGLAEDRKRRYVDAISDTVDRAAKLTGQLLAFARRQALKPEIFDAAERVRAVADMLRTIVGSRVEIVTELCCDPCLIEADAPQFETALVNMSVNARDAMDGEGRLTIAVNEVAAMPPIRGHGGGPGRFVAVSLTDTGHGIEPDKLGKIFEPFFTTKEVGKGTGLGLSQVFGFAKQSGGDVAVESEPGRGTTFTLYLPRAEDRVGGAKEAQTSRPESLPDGRGRRVLVVEDNVEVGRFSTQLLQDLGYETVWATNGDEALKALEEGGRFDAVFSDVVMPGMSGVELGLEIRRRHPQLPVVLTSGYSHVLANEGRHGFELLQKPYAVENLSKTLRRATRGDRPRGAETGPPPAR